jgi:glycosyltransferase involved in cell wall biosynthesis
MAVHVFVPRWMDGSDTNAQNSNARALLSRFSDPRARWMALRSDPVDFASRNGCEALHISRSRWWELELALFYQTKFDAVFYPGPHWGDLAGLRLRSLSGRRVPVIATLEGIIASPGSVKRLSDLVGHEVFSQPGTEKSLPRIRRLYGDADHIIAISPFLARVANFLYGEKVSYLPLGIERTTFHSEERQEFSGCRVVGCGTVKSSKNPQIFLSLAERFPEADFVWFGDGELTLPLNAEAERRGLNNLRFPGPLGPDGLAEQFRKSSLLVLPSHAEGAPKAAQEAAACGLPVVLNGHYESPTVIHDVNGLVAWSDEELIAHTAALIHDPEKRRNMGDRGAAMAQDWDWDRVAPQWEELVIKLASR